MDRSKIISRAKKLKELSDRGVGGEKENATAMLKDFMAKHNITEEEMQSNVSDNSLANMSDEQFMNEMIKEMFPAAFGVLFSRFGKEYDQIHTKEQMKSLTKKYLMAIFERISNQTKKYKK